ncbi:MAG: hypothetical protein DMF79_06910 [Acidobacteria bacterium]|nr:MAG: hypothetical protein DMF79_06910 [Acidobacteriota bacterium]
MVCLEAAPAAAGDLRGRVRSENKPVVGATVSAVALESPLEAARREARRQELPKPLATATAKADGTFLLAVPSAPTTPPFQLQVAGGVSPVRLERVFEPGETDDLGDLEAGRGETLAGRVVDRSGGPIVGASVTLWGGSARGIRGGEPSEPLPATTTTGADGRFRFTEATEQGNRLRVEAPGFAAAELTGLRSGALRRPVVPGLGRAVTGVVTLPDRKSPAPGALVRFEASGVTGRWAEARADGSFVLEGLPREGGMVLADAGERGRGTTPAPAGGARALVVLAPTGAVRGRVVDADTAAPIAGIRVMARGEGGAFWDRSGRDGRYEIRGLAPRAYRLSADDPRYVPWSRPAVAVTAGQAAAQDVPLVRGASLAGRVVDEEGRPIEGAGGILSASGEHPVRFFFRTGGGIGAFRTARDGSFKATRLLSGANQRLTVSHEDYEAHTIGGIVLTAGATKSGLVVVLPKGLGVRGIVKDENGLPLPGADVEMAWAFTFQSGRGASQFSFVGRPMSRPRKQTGPDGRFEFRGLASGDYTLVASKRGYSRDRIDPVKVAEGRGGEAFELVLKPGATISGFVKDRGGNGVPGYRLAARPSGAVSGPMMGPFGGPLTEEPTGADGSFFIEGLAAGESYELQVMSETGPGARKAGVTAPAEGVEITVTGKGRIRGQVADADGHAVTDFEVAYVPPAAGGGMRFSMRVGPGRGRGPGQMVSVHAEDGRFELDDVPAGKWDVEATASGYQRGRAAGIGVEEGGSAEGVEVRLTRGAAILGRVLESRSGRPVMDASVRADVATGPRFPRMGLEPGDHEASSDADGRTRPLPGDRVPPELDRDHDQRGAEGRTGQRRDPPGPGRDDHGHGGERGPPGGGGVGDARGGGGGVARSLRRRAGGDQRRRGPLPLRAPHPRPLRRDRVPARAVEPPRGRGPSHGRRGPGREPGPGGRGHHPRPGLRPARGRARGRERQRPRPRVLLRLHAHRRGRHVRAHGGSPRLHRPLRAGRRLHGRGDAHRHREPRDRRGPERSGGRDRFRDGLPRGREGHPGRTAGPGRVRERVCDGRPRRRRRRPDRRERGLHPRGSEGGHLHHQRDAHVHRRRAHPAQGAGHRRHHGGSRGPGRAHRGSGGRGGVGPAPGRGRGPSRGPGARTVPRTDDGPHGQRRAVRHRWPGPEALSPGRPEVRLPDRDS